MVEDEEVLATIQVRLAQPLQVRLVAPVVEVLRHRQQLVEDSRLLTQRASSVMMAVKVYHRPSRVSVEAVVAQVLLGQIQ
jgi:hypothetical protein